MLVCDEVELVTVRVPPERPFDLGLVDELARLQLAARRLGCSIKLRHACPELLELLEIVGLSDVVSGGDEPSLP